MSSSRETSVRRRILIVDNHPLIRRGLTALIDSEPDLTVCGVAATRRAGFEAIVTCQPDLVITDLSLEDGVGSDGLALVKDIRARNEDLPVLVLTMHDTPRYAQLVVQAGASGYVIKQEMSETLLMAIRSLLDGESYIGPKSV